MDVKELLVCALNFASDKKHEFELAFLADKDIHATCLRLYQSCYRDHLKGVYTDEEFGIIIGTLATTYSKLLPEV